jgi:hypothetical protein
MAPLGRLNRVLTPVALYRTPSGQRGPLVNHMCASAVTAQASLLAVLCVCVPLRGFAADQTSMVRFNRDVRPIMSENCFACHGPDQKSRKGGLRLDTRDGLFSKLETGQIPVVAGKPDASELMRRIESKDPDEKMPPPDSGHALTPARIDTLRSWIARGAQWEGHWSYILPVRPKVPNVQIHQAGAGWSANPIDCFIMARLARERLSPSPEADRITLARRLSLDITGLPILASDAMAFCDDPSPVAYDRLVDRLLASPHFGERMAVYWLDLVRYGDSGGYHSDGEHFISPYRDYVIAALNDNIPFDRFTREQIAGDLLPDRTLDQLVASGYNRLNKTTEEGGAQPGEYLVKHNADRIRTTSGAWLGITIGCAECHDHKYDPITTADFYGLSAFFADIQEVGYYEPGSRPPEIRVPTRAQLQRLKTINAELSRLRQRLTAEKDATAAVRQKDLQNQIDALVAESKKIEKNGTRTMITVSMTPREIRILPRGNWLDHSGPVVLPAVPAALRTSLTTAPARSAAVARKGNTPVDDLRGTPKEKRQRLTRRDLGDWLVSRENPLTARVLVNRLWKLFLGTGISKQLDDVGVQGEWPVHPELLDWLAVELMESGWDIKHAVRLIVTSQTYRQSSLVSDSHRRLDPENRLCARQSRWRLEAEFIRDTALVISGLLVDHIGGPSVKPYQPAGYWAYLNFPMREWHHDVGPNQYRRGIYTHWQRTFPHPSLLAFDAPPREECTAQRPISNTPSAALALLNDPTYVEAARVFAGRILHESGMDDEARIRWAWRQAVVRNPLPEETRLLAELCRTRRQQFARNHDAAKKLVSVGIAPVPETLETVELAAWTEVARAILNLHETITRE